jgi:hypothetical protein
MGKAAKPRRANRTITVDFQNEATYFQLLGDGKAFVECVLAFVLSLGFQLTHKVTCTNRATTFLTPVRSEADLIQRREHLAAHAILCALIVNR